MSEYKKGYFSDNVIKLAQQTQEKYGVPASVTLAQFALESGYGTSDMAKRQNNFFGIRGSYNGNSVNGWRAYGSVEQSFDDHGALLAKPIYANKTAGVTNAKDYAYAIGETYCPSGGTNSYAKSLVKIMDMYNLTQYDSGNYTGSGSGSSVLTDAHGRPVSNAAGTGGADNISFSSGGSGLRDALLALLSALIKGGAVAAVVILGAVFFMQAFDLKLPKAGGSKND